MVGAEEAVSQPEEAPPRHEDRLDTRGCLVFGVRYLGCTLTLYILMFAAILFAAMVGALLFGG